MHPAAFRTKEMRFEQAPSVIVSKLCMVIPGNDCSVATSIHSTSSSKKRIQEHQSIIRKWWQFQMKAMSSHCCYQSYSSFAMKGLWS